MYTLLARGRFSDERRWLLRKAVREEKWTAGLLVRCPVLVLRRMFATLLVHLLRCTVRWDGARAKYWNRTRALIRTREEEEEKAPCVSVSEWTSQANTSGEGAKDGGEGGEGRAEGGEGKPTAPPSHFVLLLLTCCIRHLLDTQRLAF